MTNNGAGSFAFILVPRRLNRLHRWLFSDSRFLSTVVQAGAVTTNKKRLSGSNVYICTHFNSFGNGTHGSISNSSKCSWREAMVPRRNKAICSNSKRDYSSSARASGRTTLANDFVNRASSRTGNAFDDAVAALPKGAQIQLDFFGEPATFLGMDAEKDSTTNAMAALDGFLLAIVSKGKTCIGGGEEEGIEVQSAHSSAIAWSELLRHATVWNNTDDISEKAAPMLVVAAVSPILAQGAGVGYIRYLDKLLQKVESGVPGLTCPIQMLPMAQHVVDCNMEVSNLNPRELSHIKALNYMLKHQHRAALYTLVELLRTCPGDVLALSLVMDLANTVGDSQIALRAAASIAAYWNERKGGIIRPTIPGYAIACAYQALGFAVGGRHAEAEELAVRTMSKAKKVCGGVSTWALAHVFDAQGRTAEGISFLANSDGVRNYEGSGFLFFESRLAMYGARYSLDREERGRGRSAALRLYDRNIEKVLQYSGFSQGRPLQSPQRKGPLGWIQSENEAEEIMKKKEKSGMFTFLSNLSFPGQTSKSSTTAELTKIQEADNSKTESEIVLREQHSPSLLLDLKPYCEDVLTWLPPTPQLLSDATLLMWRMTLNGTIAVKDHRWDSLRNAWKSLLDLENTMATNLKQNGVQMASGNTLEYAPLACMSASILIPPAVSGGDKIGTGRLASGLYMMGELMKLGDIGNAMPESNDTNSLLLFVAERQPDFWLPAKEEEPQKEWKVIVDHLNSAMDGFEYYDGDDNSCTGIVDFARCDRSLRFEAWTFDARPLLEHAFVYAACKAGDNQSLCRARSICSQGVTLRPNSPEEWWRYSIVLGLLGDEIASEDALAASVNLGAGQGAKPQ